MSWSQNSAKALLAGLAAIIVIAAGPPPAKVLVVRSTGTSAKSYPVGRSLPENSQITLGTGDTVTLLGSAGTLTLRGPGTFAATVLVRPEPNPIDPDRHAVIGGVRSTRQGPQPLAQDAVRAFSVWRIDATQSGNFCQLRSIAVMLWRPDVRSPMTLTAVAARGAAQTLTWPAGRNTIVWKPLSPLIDGGRYTLRNSEGVTAAQFTVHVVRLTTNSPQAAAAALIKHGCQQQLEALLDDTRTRRR